uniref:Uncharacterized protein n=1 Tax=Cyclophora tenuis TaxID=216820 RepID=A0A6U1NLL7_CYCTE|mmetsp:Transcript_10468/g.17627  ORF Transcript_10468/g.17627 Transcript_10468/m.17627 type:complete len:312 (+) Transcript_10468:63-998(+)
MVRISTLLSLVPLLITSVGAVISIRNPTLKDTLTYTQTEIDLAYAYVNRSQHFSPNYYTMIGTTVGACFEGVVSNLPQGLLDETFTVDFSTRESTRLPPLIIEDALRIAGIKMYRRTDRNTSLDDIIANYNKTELLAENKDWWLAHCQALRDGDKVEKDFTIDGVTETYIGTTVLANEYHYELKYFVKDSLYDTVGSPTEILGTPSTNGLNGYWYGSTTGTSYEDSWWALLANPRVQMTWPRVTFEEQEVAFDWICFDVNTNEATAYGNVVFFRAGDVGAAYKKYEHLYYLRDAYKPFFDAYFYDQQQKTN